MVLKVGGVFAYQTFFIIMWNQTVLSHSGDGIYKLTGKFLRVEKKCKQLTVLIRTVLEIVHKNIVLELFRYYLAILLYY